LTVLAATRVFTGDGGVTASPAWVAVQGDRIVAIGTGAIGTGSAGTGPGTTDDVVDLGDALLAPGAIDIQINGHGDVDFADAAVDEIVDVLDALLATGCTTCLPTVVTAGRDAYEPVLERLAAVRQRRPGAIGVHLEGPFLGGAPGAHPVDLIRAVELEWLLELCDRFGDLVRLVTLAPEADVGLSATRALTARGVTVALGHTTASYEAARAAADAGARVVTHLFNGMGPMHHRAPGVAGAALDDRRLIPSLIADLVHVHPAVLRLAIAIRSDAVLVTDAVGGDFHGWRDGAAFLEDGTLAGSSLTIDAAVRNVVELGVAPAQAVRMATGNPARALGLGDRGRLAPGCRADLVVLDPDTLTVRETWQGGRRVYAADPTGS
jgi:N-acetylglucosamine-6-phosphate deacetylase